MNSQDQANTSNKLVATSISISLVYPIVMYVANKIVEEEDRPWIK